MEVREREETSAHTNFQKFKTQKIFQNVFLSKKTTTTYHFPHGIVLQRKQNETIVSAVVEERFWELLFFRWHFFVVCVFIDSAACAFLMKNFKSFGERIVFFSQEKKKTKKKLKQPTRSGRKKKQREQKTSSFDQRQIQRLPHKKKHRLRA
jgi:hypothetical protein